jgi:hypothetical protein
MILGDNNWALRNILNKFRETNGVTGTNYNFDYTSADPKERIYFFDNFYELLLRESGYLHTDVNFYGLAWETFNKRSKTNFSLSDLLKHLKEREEETLKAYRRMMPGKIQDGPYCGLFSLINSLISFGHPESEIKKEEWSQRVITKGHLNNLPTTLTKIALEEGYPSYLVINMEDYEKNVINSPRWKNHVVLDRMLAEMKDIPILPVKDITGEFAKNIIQEGGTLFFVIDFGTDYDYNLHYNLAYGYKENTILVYDPLGTHKKISMSDFGSFSRNKYSCWGVVVFPREHTIHSFIDEHIDNLESFIKQNFGGEIYARYQKNLVSSSK